MDWPTTTTAMILLAAAAGGCDRGLSKRPDAAAKHGASAESPPAKRRTSTPDSSRTPVRKATASAANPKPVAKRQSPDPPQPDPAWTQDVPAWDLDERQAVALVCGEIHAACRVAPTLVVWLMDHSASANGMRRQVAMAFGDHYHRLLAVTRPSADGSTSAIATDSEPRLLTAVHAFDESETVLTAAPTADAFRLQEAIGRAPRERTGRENTFTAIQSAATRYLPYRTQQRREMILVVVTDEAGDDAAQAEKAIEQLAKYRVPVYVIGSPAPLGQISARSVLSEVDSVRGKWGDWIPVRQGPESRSVELISLAFWDFGGAAKWVDSGFGPFALESLARKTGGRFLAVRSSRAEDAAPGDIPGGWPAGTTLRFDPTAMQRYAPDYGSESAYQTLLQENRARMALHLAAKIAPSETLQVPARTFTAKDPAALKRELDRAQRAAARLEPEIQRFYDALAPAESDRPRLTGARWQAAYDLALGRVLLAKARIEGYNAMLALLKQGRKFQRPESKQWILTPADTTEAGSALQKLGDRGRQTLQRVVKEHPGTPWALIAEHELRTPVGWAWTEQ